MPINFPDVRKTSILLWAIAITFLGTVDSYGYGIKRHISVNHPSSSSPLFSYLNRKEDSQPKRRRRFQESYEPNFETSTRLERVPTQPKNPNPKIVVLGATGKIGRRIISKLMTLDTQMTIVAVCRSYDVACDVLYDELTTLERNKGGPRLQLVVADLIGKQDLAGYDVELERRRREEEDEEDLEFAVSASRFFSEDLKNYDFRGGQIVEDDWIDPDLSLKEAIRNCTAVISAVGTIRPTIPFGDYIFKPWRIFVSPGRWCRDERHPYYVNYLIMKKVLKYAESEQRRRENEWDEYFKTKVDDGVDEEEAEKRVEKIRIIRISDLCVSNPAWNLVTVITNIALSLVFRYQEKCEKLLEASSIVDTIVLRPGDLMEADRVSINSLTRERSNTRWVYL